jgi:ribose transport system ATP-binding protein
MVLMDVPLEERGQATAVQTAALRITGASKAFGANQAVDDVSFDLARGQVHALLGGNGSGKSTLIKMLAGVHPADRGTIEVAGDRIDLPSMTPARAAAAGLQFVHQQQSTFPELSVAENLAIGGPGFPTATGGRIKWRTQRSRARQALERFEIDAHPDQLLADLGPARRTMVAIARALQYREEAGENILLLDEPTASLPETEVKLLLDALRRYAERGETIVYVTHRLEEVFAVADHAILLRDGRLVDEVVPSEITHDDLVELIMGRTVEQVERLRGTEPGAVILETQSLASGPLRPLDLTIRSGEVVGVAGLIGSGRSTLLKTLFGIRQSEQGSITLDGERLRLTSPRDAMRAGLAYVPEDRGEDAAFPDLSLVDNMSVAVVGEYWRGGRVRGRQERRDATALLEDFQIKAESVDDPISSLSGGNQQKAIVARWLRRKPRVLLLDEPTQGVDVGARAEIYSLIHQAVEHGSAALVASSDSVELAAICDRVIVLRRGRLVGEIPGSELTSDRLERLAHADAETS